MKCWFCEKDARGVCIACGRAVCYDHGNKMDQFTHAKSDTSTGFTSYFKAYNVLKCQDCKVEWENWEQGKRVIR